MKIKWKKTIFSDGSSNFLSNPTPTLYEDVKFSIRIHKDTKIEDIFLVVWPKGEVHYYEMYKDKEDEFFSWYSINLLMKDLVLNYRFFLMVDGKEYYYTPQGVFDFEPPDYFSFSIFVGADYSKWTPDTIFYQIFPDRFAKSGDVELDNRDYKIVLKEKTIEFKRVLCEWDEPIEKNLRDNKVVQFYGGNFRGIKEKITYLKELGVSAVYLTPIFLARSNHRYDVEDYEKPDTLLGDEKELVELIEELHQSGIKVIFDGVLNHTGLYHRWFDHLGEFGDGAFSDSSSQYKDFYIFNEHPYNYESWFDCKILPQLNYQNVDLINKLLYEKNSAIKKWLRPPFNIDGWRMDTASILGKFPVTQMDDIFSKELHKSIKEENNDGYIMGETFYDPAHLIGREKYEATMNYRGFMTPIKKWLTGKTHFLTFPKGKEEHIIKSSSKKLSSQMSFIRNSIPFQNQIRMYNLLNSHDTPRFITEIGNDFDKLKIAVTLLFTYIGIPSIYYGDEVGLEGETDPDCRRPMIWDESKQNKQINTLYKSLINLRKDNNILTYGSFIEICNEDNVFCFARMLNGEHIIVICNGSNESFKKNIGFEALGIINKKIKGFYSGVTKEISNLECEFALAPFECEIYIC